MRGIKPFLIFAVLCLLARGWAREWEGGPPLTTIPPLSYWDVLIFFSEGQLFFIRQIKGFWGHWVSGWVGPTSFPPNPKFLGESDPDFLRQLLPSPFVGWLTDWLLTGFGPRTLVGECGTMWLGEWSMRTRARGFFIFFLVAFWHGWPRLSHPLGVLTVWFLQAKRPIETSRERKATPSVCLSKKNYALTKWVGGWVGGWVGVSSCLGCPPPLEKKLARGNCNRPRPPQKIPQICKQQNSRISRKKYCEKIVMIIEGNTKKKTWQLFPSRFLMEGQWRGYLQIKETKSLLLQRSMAKLW